RLASNPTPGPILDASLRWHDNKPAALKFKITNNWPQEAEYLTEIRKSVGPDMPIRLDANQKLSLTGAINFGKRVVHLNIAYFEEPLKDPSQIPEFVQATGIPVALDESLSTTYHCHPGLDPGSSTRPRLPEGITTLALKPFMMPDLKTIFYWIDLANEQNLDIAICSCFESSLGLSWLVMLAAIASPKLLPAGLSTYSWFENNFFEPRFTTSESLKQIKNFRI
ncbi:MAG: hypothetical protein JKY15_07645, partial [Deltaproteobacteria bacterium]|nr:hypothetical protein [Deltaproteobacteria bacterium]